MKRKTEFQEADDDARQIHREVSGEPHVPPLLPQPMAPSQDNTQDVMSSPIISDDGQGETQENLFAGVDVTPPNSPNSSEFWELTDIPSPPPNSPNPKPMLEIDDEFIGFEGNLPETPEGLEWRALDGSEGSYILAGVIPKHDSQPSTSHQTPFTALGLPVMMHGLPLRISSPPHCCPSGTDDSQWAADESESLPDESQLDTQEYDGGACAIALRWATDDIKCIHEAAALINEEHAIQAAASQSSARPLPSMSHSDVVQNIHENAPMAKKPRLSQPPGD